MFNVSILGLGNFGYALLKHLSKKQETAGNFLLYGFDNNKELMDYLRAEGRHLYHHKNVIINGNIIFADNLKELTSVADVLILAVPSDSIRDLFIEIKNYIKKELIILNTAKALDNATGQRLSVVIKELLGELSQHVYIAMFAGGTIASDLFGHEPLGVDIASENKEILPILKGLFSTDNLNVYVTDDLTGVEYAAAFKNVIAILAGIINGLGFSYGSETHMISRAAGEVKRLVVNRLGGKEKTFSIESQCWGNDLWMSCTGNTRNREFGILIGKGLSAEEALKRMREQNKTVEGINTIKVISKLINDGRDLYPILCAIKKIICYGYSPREIIKELMNQKRI
jgi:glycerol-3-phosphate dehydrogenase (NAD(P)+)